MARMRSRSLGVMAPGRMAFGKSDAGETKGERKDGRDGRNIPLQKHLPTDFEE
jgi:hypothetical protein